MLTAAQIGGGDGYKIGDTVKDFKLQSSLDGNYVSLSSYENPKGYIVIFTCNHCPYAKMYEDRIIALHKEYEAKGFPVVAINPNAATVEDDSYTNMKIRAAEKGYPFHYLNDESQEVAQAFGASKTPHVYLLDANKVVQYIGAIDNDPKDEKESKTLYLEEAIASVAAGKKVNVKETKAVGCTIKWKK
jgi:peroxiredoxin